MFNDTPAQKTDRLLGVALFKDVVLMLQRTTM